MRTDLRWGLRLALIPLAFLLGVRVLHFIRDFGHPTELLHISTVPARLALEITHHRPVYRRFDAPPYYLALYGPLLYYVPGWMNRGLGLEGTNLLMFGRALSLTALLVGAWTLAVLLRRWARAGPCVTWLMTGMFLASGVLWPIGMCFRPDAAEFMFVVLAGAAMLRWERSNLRLATIPLLLLAFLYKQSALNMLVSFALYLWLRGRRGAAVRYLATGVVVFAVTVLAINAATDGAYVLNCFVALDANLTFSNLWTVWGGETAASVAGPFVLTALRLRRRGRSRIELPSLLAMVGGAAACAASIRDGSGVNYFIQPLAWACVSAGRELASCLRAERLKGRWPAEPGRIARRKRTPRGFIAACAFGVSLILPVRFHLADLPLQLRLTAHRHEYKRQAQNLLNNVSRLLNELDGPVITELGALGLYLERPYMLDLLTFTGLADQKVFDDRPLMEDIRERRLAAFVLEFDLERDGIPFYQSTARVRREWLEAMRDANYLHLEAGWLHLYVRPESFEAARPGGSTAPR